MNRFVVWAMVLIGFISIASAQETNTILQIHGSFQLDAQSYQEDSLINAPKVSEKSGMNAYGNFLMTYGDFEAGFRLEAYLPPLQGIDTRYRGAGMPYRYFKYKKDDIEVTLGNFYEQFGNGLVFRTYQEWNLGLDNSVDGFRVKYMPYQGIRITALAGNQRYFWNKGSGIVRGADAEIMLNQTFEKLAESKTRIIFGGSFVSKYQRDLDPVYILPENVAAWAGRINVSRGKMNVSGEYAQKINDPSAINNYIYKNGEALCLQASYSQKGLGINIGAKRIDNMSFRSDRTATGTPLNINYLPALTKQHSYSLPSIYPYATQPNGEMGFQANVQYKVKKKSMLGGPYGTDISVNFSKVHDIQRKRINDTTSIGQKGTLGYKSDFFSIGKKRFFEDFNIEIQRKFNKNFKASAQFINLVYSKEVVEGHIGEPSVYAKVLIGDFSWMIRPARTLRFELQHMNTHQDMKNWALLGCEFSTTKWFAAIYDQYNYGNPDNNKKIHYYTVSAGYTKGPNRIALAWGKQREGIICVGGVCRAVPASYGLTLNITSSF